DDDCAGDNGLAGLRILPPVPQASETQHASVRAANEIRLPTVWPFQPLVITAGRNDAPMPLEGIAEHRLISDALCTGIEARRQLPKRLVPPPWNEPPAH